VEDLGVVEGAMPAVFEYVDPPINPKSELEEKEWLLPPCKLLVLPPLLDRLRLVGVPFVATLFDDVVNRDRRDWSDVESREAIDWSDLPSDAPEPTRCM
jgi:hypothetical protein